MVVVFSTFALAASGTTRVTCKHLREDAVGAETAGICKLLGGAVEPKTTKVCSALTSRCPLNMFLPLVTNYLFKGKLPVHVSLKAGLRIS